MGGPSFEQIRQYFEGGNDVPPLRNEFSQMEILGNHQRFVVARMGSTGSTWLAKLLNSHVDVFCTHEQVLGRVASAGAVSSADICNLVREIATSTHHGAYRAAGDVGSVWLSHAVALRGRFKTALLLRHPARLLSTRLKVYPTDQSYTQVHPANLNAIRQLWNINVGHKEMIDAVFIQDLFVFVSQAYGVDKIDLIVRIEDLADPDYCRQFLHALTGIRYDAGLVAQALRRPVNRRNTEATIGEIVNGFTPDQRDWYRRMLSEVAPSWGYELDRDVTGAPMALGKREPLSASGELSEWQ